MGIKFKVLDGEEACVELTEKTIDICDIIVDTEATTEENFKTSMRILKIRGKLTFDDFAEEIVRGSVGEATPSEVDSIKNLATWALMPENCNCYKRVETLLTTASGDVMNEEIFENAFVVEYEEEYSTDSGSMGFYVVMRDRMDEIAEYIAPVKEASYNQIDNPPLLFKAVATQTNKTEKPNVLADNDEYRANKKALYDEEQKTLEKLKMVFGLNMNALGLKEPSSLSTVERKLYEKYSNIKKLSNPSLKERLEADSILRQLKYIDPKNIVENKDNELKIKDIDKYKQIVNAEQLESLGWSNVTVKEIDDLNKNLKKYNITETEQVRVFLANVMKESGSGRNMLELRYPDQTTEEYFGNEYYGKGEKPNQKGKLLGNESREDAVKFRGAGYIQLTGRSNYTAFSNNLKEKGIDDKNILELGSEYVAANYPWEAACYFWESNNINSAVEASIKIINSLEENALRQMRKDNYKKVSGIIK